MRAGAAGAADGTDDLAVLDQRNAAPRGDHVIERRDIHKTGLLDGVLEGLGRAAISRRGTRLVLGNRERGELCAVHALERDQVTVGIDHRGVERPVPLLGLARGLACGGAGA